MQLQQDAEKLHQRRSRIAQSSTYRTYASPLRSLRPCWTAFLRILTLFWPKHRTETFGHTYGINRAFRNLLRVDPVTRAACLVKSRCVTSMSWVQDGQAQNEYGA